MKFKYEEKKIKRLERKLCKPVMISFRFETFANERRTVAISLNKGRTKQDFTKAAPPQQEIYMKLTLSCVL